MVGLPEVDTKTDHVTWLERGRGAGGCGDWFRYAVRGDRFVLQEHRSRGCDEDELIVDPSEWTLTK